MDAKNIIAKRIAKELKQGDVINLGIGIPTFVANHVPKGIEVVFQSENGILGIGPAAGQGKEDQHITNAGGHFITVLPGASFFDSATSFAIIRGKHVDVTVLGALQVDEQGNIASWMVPGKMVKGMGGAMDLVAGAKRIIAAMIHTSDGEHKILKKCTYPLTGAKVVDRIVTEIAVIDVTEKGLVLRETAPGLTANDVQAATGAPLIIADDLKTMELD